MPYDYDIFLSYRRTDGDRVKWTRKLLLPPLRSFLKERIGSVNIFFDGEIETGLDWPDKMADALAASKILIPVLSPAYFCSDWCRLEFALMHHRSESMQCPLILPIIIEGEDKFEPKVQSIQGLKFHKYGNPWICIGTPTYQKFTQKLRDWIPEVESAIQRVPVYDPNWRNLNRANFQNLFRMSQPITRTVPNIGAIIPLAAGGANS